ncbi:Uncharacterised protein [Starkeya nomas]|uniref:Uncharacterized protein n=1 Tax=Starkeya nomas TaxID=2666134 RepID=A0A5S9NZ20_9HYPH|nr:hypothetical protein [Starkeya nomas]CAA0096154.1 Uncharacterised protein [Starkeya nomas]
MTRKDTSAKGETPVIVAEGPETQASAELQAELAAKQKAADEAAAREAEDAKRKAAEEQEAADEAAEQERADMEAIGRSFMNTLTVVTSEPEWKDWSPAEDPVEIVTDMLAMIDELRAQVSQEPEPLPEGTRTTPLGWDELAPYSSAGTVMLASWVVEGAVSSFIMKTEPFHQFSTDNWGAFAGASDGMFGDVLAYALDRRPAPEVLFNKMRELGHVTGQWHELLPVDRAAIELAARIIPAVADVVETLNAEMVHRFPPPAPAVATRLVDIEDTVLERVAGIADVDPQMAAARTKADRLRTLPEAAGKNISQNKLHSIGDGVK